MAHISSNRFTVSLKAFKAFAVLAVLILVAGCGVYTFSGSSLPAYLKTVDIPLFVNNSLQPGVAEEITEGLTREVLSSNLLRIVSSQGDATINGRVVSYANQPHTYGSRGAREVDISEYAVKIAVEVEFVDNKKNKPIYKGTIVGEGIYNFDSETEDIGRSKAIDHAVEQIIQNSVQGW
ncbi:MAG: hypothetical protein GF401_11460 [Chitinivibrionales bacterium]|nr:hypothetical protein [Chitinivibrionales bacterium]